MKSLRKARAIPHKKFRFLPTIRGSRYYKKVNISYVNSEAGKRVDLELPAHVLGVTLVRNWRKLFHRNPRHFVRGEKCSADIRERIARYEGGGLFNARDRLQTCN